VDRVMEIDEGGIIELVSSGRFGQDTFSPVVENSEKPVGDFRFEPAVEGRGIDIASEIGLHQAFELAESTDATPQGQSAIQDIASSDTGDPLPQSMSSDSSTTAVQEVVQGGGGESHVHAASAPAVMILAALSFWGQQRLRGGSSTTSEINQTFSGRVQRQISRLARRMWKAITFE
jgi:hypothetical protein